jgi:hypothetical protein
MKVAETEYSVFRAIVKGIGVYQLVLCLTDLLYLIIERADFKLGGPVGHEWHYVAWAVFHFCVALILFFGTDLFCRIAFPRPASAEANSGGA